MSELPPIRREVLVNADPATAFRIFTERIGAWWPIADLSVFGEGASVVFEGGELVEQAPDGQRAIWGTVARWEPGVVVAFTWHPGRPADRSSHVEVCLSAADMQTLVTLEHSGWEVFDDPSAARDEYGHGWVQVLDQYHDAVDGADEAETGDTWIALLHRPGPNAPATDSIFAAPQFAEHIGFLRRMQEAGYLIAAGSLPDAEGEGMTILRLPGKNRFEEARTLATQDDQSVATGFFSVVVRPWQVALSNC